MHRSVRNLMQSKNKRYYLIRIRIRIIITLLSIKIIIGNGRETIVSARG